MNKYLQESYDDALRENVLLKAKLEQAEKALEEIRDADESDILVRRLNAIAEKALKAIRRN